MKKKRFLKTKIVFIRVFTFDFGFMNIGVNSLLTILFLYLIKTKDSWKPERN